MKEASFYTKKANGVTVCLLCPHSCHIVKGRTGFCRARKNIDGTLIAEGYGRIVSLALDPIEKKPLHKFHPGTMILSVGNYGCNMKCHYCQNHTISQQTRHADFIPPEKLLELAQNASNNIGIAFTYNEPLINPEYILDTAPLFKAHGLKIALVTNGMIRSEPFQALLPYIDTVNIDVKTFDANKYKKLGGNLTTVMNTVETCAHAGINVEITSLIVPGQNDNAKDMHAQCQWLAKISPDIPLHLSRFFPNYKMTNASPTPIETLEEMAGIAKQYLKYVSIGNVR